MRYARRYFIPLGVSFAFFIVGIYWGSISSLLRPVFLDISNNLVQLEALSQSRPLESGLVFAVIGALIPPFWVWVNRIMRSVIEQPAILELLFRNERKIHSIVAHTKQASFRRIGENTEVILPENALFLPSTVATSIILLSAFCNKWYGERKTPVFHHDHDHWDAPEHNFMCVGGPFVNETMKHILDCQLMPGFSIDDIPTALDDGDRFQAARKKGSTDQNAPITEDYGFVIFIDNPWNHNKKICALFGLWPHGTQAAVETTLLKFGRLTYARQKLLSLAVDWFGMTPDRSYYFIKLYDCVKHNKNAIGILHVPVAGLLAGKAEVIKVRTF